MTKICSKCHSPFETDRKYHSYCWSCYWKERDAGKWRQKWNHEQRPREWMKTQQLDVRFLKDAIFLCHPDRQPKELYDKANAVTRTLIELYKAQSR